MKTFILSTICLSASMILSGQSWDDPVSTSDWNSVWRSSFLQSLNATNAPESSGWFWGINLNHSSNSSTYKYNGQIAIKNDHDSPTMYYRSTDASGNGVWAKVIDRRPSSIGNLTTINSLRIFGNNLDGKDLTFLSNTGSTVIGWNRSQGHGETSFISNRGLGSLGGFEFRDIDNSGNEQLLLKLKGDGSVAIGTTQTSSHKLAVNGTIGAREIKVETTTWPDYVFSDDYELRSLEEVRQHIDENGHLPEIPSEADVAENGILLGEMNAKLLQKIEELTLYVIDINEQVQKLKEENHSLKETGKNQ
jgi:hypothetical protein